jgi:hypothetical protein
MGVLQVELAYVLSQLQRVEQTWALFDVLCIPGP